MLGREVHTNFCAVLVWEMQEPQNYWSSPQQSTSYYPFGLKMPGLSFVATGADENTFTYNGKELEDEFGLDWYHYGARFYDPAVGRWWAIDPVDQYSSPYTYVGNNPVIFIDPNGMFGDYFDRDGTHLGSDGIDDGKVYIRDDNGSVEFGVGVLEKGYLFSEIDLKSDLGFLARIGFAEFRGSNIIEQQLGMGIVLNRVESNRFPNEIESVITQRWQFSALNPGDPNKKYYDDPVSQVIGSEVNHSAWVRTVSNAIRVQNGSARGISQGAILYYSPMSMDPPYSLPDWNFNLLRELSAWGARSSHIRMFDYK